MKKNWLYSLIENNLVSLPGNPKITLAQTLDKKKYYRIALTPVYSLQKALTLEEAHLSIYEKRAPKNSRLDVCHITFQYKNSAGEQFRLHIFLNANFAVACEPTWDQIDKEGNFTSLPLPANQGALIQAALHSVASFIPIFHAQHQTELRRLEADFNILDGSVDKFLESMQKKVTDSDLMQRFLSTLKEAKKVLQSLSNWSDHPKWKRLEFYFSTIIKKEELSLLPVHSEIGIIEKKLIEDGDSFDENNRSEMPSLTFFEPQKTKPKKIIASLQKQFEALSLCWSQKNIDGTIHLLNEIYYRMIDDSFRKLDVSLENLPQLKIFEKEVETIARTLLQNILLQHDFKKAQKLKIFYPSLNPNLLALSLQMGDHQLLEFLIKNTAVSLNTPLIIRSISYPHALAYCFAHSDQPAMVKCATVLVENGADLMLAEKEGALPMAHTLLAATSHPLYALK